MGETQSPASGSVRCPGFWTGARMPVIFGTDPCALIARARRPKAPRARSHYLTPTQLARLWEAAGGLREPVWRDLARFLIVVPCRRGEAARLDWSHLDLAAAEWRQPGHTTKNREAHRLHLHALALEVCRHAGRRSSRPRSKAISGGCSNHGRWHSTFGPSVPGAGVRRRGGHVQRHQGCVGEADRIEGGQHEVAQLTGWTWHDFRRSFATALGEAGIPEAVADAILNHRQSATRGGVLGVYQRASRWPEQVNAMRIVGAVGRGCHRGTRSRCQCGAHDIACQLSYPSRGSAGAGCSLVGATWLWRSPGRQ